MEFRQAGCKPHGADANSCRNSQITAGFFLGVHQKRFCRRQLVEYIACGTEENLALFGENEAPCMAVKQGNGKVVLKGADLPAYRRLAQAQLLAGMGETSRFGNGMEYPQLVPIHKLVSDRRCARSRPFELFGRFSRRFLQSQVFFSFQRRHAPHSSSGDSLPIDIVGDITRRIHAINRCGR